MEELIHNFMVHKIIPQSSPRNNPLRLTKVKPTKPLINFNEYNQAKLSNRELRKRCNVLHKKLNPKQRKAKLKELSRLLKEGKITRKAARELAKHEGATKSYYSSPVFAGLDSLPFVGPVFEFFFEIMRKATGGRIPKRIMDDV